MWCVFVCEQSSPNPDMFRASGLFQRSSAPTVVFSFFVFFLFSAYFHGFFKTCREKHKQNAAGGAVRELPRRELRGLAGPRQLRAVPRGQRGELRGGGGLRGVHGRRSGGWWWFWTPSFWLILRGKQKEKKHRCPFRLIWSKNIAVYLVVFSHLPGKPIYFPKKGYLGMNLLGFGRGPLKETIGEARESQKLAGAY